ncbi:hypothetical protein [Tepidibacter sp. Z1-5]|uniref:hypothetical protein n=1 Tax=Tepidibacter sp. Z1-5 TaxID=3134138 RepID=UPI0030C4169A
MVRSGNRGCEYTKISFCDKQLYSQIKNEIKSRLNTIDKKVFPSSGMFYVVLGIVAAFSFIL